MKRLVCLIAAVVLLLTSCADHGVGVYDPYHGKLDDLFSGITTAINDQDATALKTLFADSVLQQDADFDENLEVLLGFIQGRIISYEVKGHSGEKSADNGEMGSTGTVLVCCKNRAGKLYFHYNCMFGGHNES